MPTSIRRLFVVFSLAGLLVAATRGPASAAECAQPVSSGASPVASDCLFILGAAVGAQTCSPACICAPTGTLPPKATDALLCLAGATGQPVTLACPCDDEPPDGLPIGFVSAHRSTSITPGFFPGLPATILNDFSLGGTFARVTGGVAPDIDITTETVAGCTVTTTDLHLESNPDDPLPTATNYDPGAPGEAFNGDTALDLLRETSDGFESFAPAEDPLAEGYDGGQTIQFSWPGGDDINAFSSSIAVPPNVVVTSPNLESASFGVNPGDTVSLQWVPGTDDDGKLAVALFSSITSFTQGQNGSSTIDSTSISIVCLFTDSAGSGSVPSAATSRLQQQVSLPQLFAKSITISRENTKTVGVTAPGNGGARDVSFIATNSLSRSLASGLPF